jgi:hypothetical protein
VKWILVKQEGGYGLDFDLDQDRDQWKALVNTVMDLRVPYNVVKFLSGSPTGGFCTRTKLHGVSLLVSHLTSPIPS